MGYNFGLNEDVDGSKNIYKDVDLTGTLNQFGRNLGVSAYNMVNGTNRPTSPLPGAPAPAPAPTSVRQAAAPQQYNNNEYENRPNLEDTLIPDPAKSFEKFEQEPGTRGAYFQPESQVGEQIYTRGDQMLPGDVENVGGTQFRREILPNGKVRYDDGKGNFMEGVRQKNMGQGGMSVMDFSGLRNQAATQQANPIRSRLDDLYAQLDKSRDIFNRRGNTLQDYRRAAAERKDLRAQIAHLEGMEKQSASDAAQMERTKYTSDASTRSANQLTPWQTYQIGRNQQQDLIDAEEKIYERGKDEAATSQAKKDELGGYIDTLAEAQTPEDRAVAEQKIMDRFGSSISKQLAEAQTDEDVMKIFNSPEGQAFALAAKQSMRAPMQSEADTVQIFGPNEAYPLGELGTTDFRGWQMGRGDWGLDIIPDNPITGYNKAIKFKGNDPVSGEVESSAYYDNLSPTGKIFATYIDRIGAAQRAMDKRKSLRNNQGQ